MPPVIVFLVSSANGDVTDLLEGTSDVSTVVVRRIMPSEIVTMPAMLSFRNLTNFLVYSFTLGVLLMPVKVC